MTETRGFLTPTDRSFLRGNVEYDTRQGRYQRRQAIRERTHAALADFNILFEELDQDERERIFEPLADVGYHPMAVEGRGEEPPESYQAGTELEGDIVGTLKFLYLGTRPYEDVAFQTLVEGAIHQTERDVFDQLVSPSVTIGETFPFGTLDDAIEKLEKGDLSRLTAEERETLVKFVMAPEAYPSGQKRETAIDRLNELEQFSLAVDDD